MSNSIENPCNQTCSKISAMEQQYHSYISHFTHELRNPLTLMYSSMQLLEKKCPDLTNTFLWFQIIHDIKDTIRLLNILAVYDQTTSPSKEKICLFSFLTDIISSFEAYMKEHQVTLSFDFNDLPPEFSISVNPITLKEAISNLLLNSVDAVSASTTAGIISLSVNLYSNQLLIHIRDNGPGIPKEFIPTLFEPFVTHKKNGNGLGLSIVRSVMKQHNGTVTVSTCNQPGSSYTDFCLQIPILKG